MVYYSPVTFCSCSLC